MPGNRVRFGPEPVLDPNPFPIPTPFPFPDPFPTPFSARIRFQSRFSVFAHFKWAETLKRDWNAPG